MSEPVTNTPAPLTGLTKFSLTVAIIFTFARAFSMLGAAACFLLWVVFETSGYGIGAVYCFIGYLASTVLFHLWANPKFALNKAIEKQNMAYFK